MPKAYITRFKLEIVKSREYCLAFLSSLLYLPVSLLIYFYLFRYLIQKDIYFSMNLSQILTYYTVVLFTKTAFQQSMAEVYYVFQDINRGYLDLWITKPTNYIVNRYFRALGCIAFTVPTTTVILAALFYGRFTFKKILLFLLSEFFGFTILFLIMIIIGSLTFWLKSVLTLRDIFWFILSIFSGELVPLSLIPKYYNILKVNPLACIYDAPYQVLNTDKYIWYLGLQIFYLVLLGIVSKLIWNLGIKRYESQGG